MYKELKICNKCNIEKPISEFYKGYNQCKECRKKQSKQYYADNIQYIKERSRKYREANKEKIKEINRLYSQNNKEKIKEKDKRWYIANSEYAKKYSLEYHHNHPEVKRNWYKRKRNTVSGKLQHNISNLLHKHLKNNKSKNTKTILNNILGYSITDLKLHLELLFEDWMTWDNHGKTALHPKMTWHIDHIKPINTFNITSIYDEDFKKCWALENLRPLDSYTNVRRPKTGSDLIN